MHTRGMILGYDSHHETSVSFSQTRACTAGRIASSRLDRYCPLTADHGCAPLYALQRPKSSSAMSLRNIRWQGSAAM